MVAKGGSGAIPAVPAIPAVSALPGGLGQSGGGSGEQLPGWLAGFSKELRKDLRTDIREELKEVKEEVKEVRNDVKKLASKTDSLEKEQQETRQMMEVMEKRIAQLEKGGKGSRVERRDFLPGFLSVKGFADYETRKTTGVSRAEANQLLEQCKASMGQDKASKLGKLKFRGVRVAQFDVFVDPEYAWEIKDLISEHIEAVNYTFNGREIYVVPERPEEVQSRYRVLGRAGGAVKRNWPQVHTSFAYAPDFALYVGDAETLLAEVSREGQLKAFAGGLAILGVDEAAFLDACSRRE